MKVHDLSMAIEWAAHEGWNPGRHDLSAFYAADPNGFFIGEFEGKPVATFSAVAYDARYGFVGFYIVHPGFRGRGFGLKIWNEGLHYLGTRTVGLDGVLAQQANYARSGFTLAHRQIRFRHEGKHTSTDMPTLESEARLVDARILPFPQVREFDRHFFPSARDAFLAHWLRQPDATAQAYLANDVLEGYGMVRPAREGWRIGPLFARNETAAIALFEALVARVPAGEALLFDAPEMNRNAVRLAKRQGMTPVFETARMYRGTPPSVNLQGIYGITSFELG